MLQENTAAPDFFAADQNGKIHQLGDYFGQWVLLYFYPKDNTPGCTLEACAMRDSYAEFEKIYAVVLGVSKDSVSSHTGFSAKYSLPFPLLSDPEKKIITAYQANGRVSYLIDPKGKIAKAYDKVKPAEHAAQVLSDLQQLLTGK
jgi:peroxiredoxin Q/BCP